MDSIDIIKMFINCQNMCIMFGYKLNVNTGDITISKKNDPEEKIIYSNKNIEDIHIFLKGVKIGRDLKND